TAVAWLIRTSTSCGFCFTSCFLVAIHIKPTTKKHEQKITKTHESPISSQSYPVRCSFARPFSTIDCTHYATRQNPASRFSLQISRLEAKARVLPLPAATTPSVAVAAPEPWHQVAAPRRDS